MLSEISQSEINKYHMISFIYGIWWTNRIHKENRDRLRDREQADSSGVGVEGGGIEQKGKKDMETVCWLWRWTNGNGKI